MSLIIDHVTGGYGHLPVLKDISFDVQPGEIVGLIGLNGAGKSTTIKHIIGLLEASKGTIEINHLSLKKNTEEYRKQIGYIPETPSLYEELTLREHIEVTAMAYDIPMDTAMKRAEKLLETFRLSNRLDPLAINALLELMVEMKKEGAGILMSTHILATAEKYCDRFVVLHNGEIRADGSLEMLRKEFQLPDSSLDEIYIALTKEQAHE